jgi:hypothetical protein
MLSGKLIGAGVIASAEVATAKTKPVTAINLIIVVLLVDWHLLIPAFARLVPSPFLH